jgi:hypothetical protein
LAVVVLHSKTWRGAKNEKRGKTDKNEMRKKHGSKQNKNAR